MKKELSKGLSKAIFILNLIGLSVITSFSWYRLFLPAAYVLGSIFIGLLLAVSLIIDHSRSNLKFLQIFTIFFFIINVFYIHTHYKVLPFGDSYDDYAVARIFDQDSKLSLVNLVQSSEFHRLISLASGWPLIHSVAVMFSSVTGIPLFQTCLLFPLITSSISFVFMYLILKKNQTALSLTDTGILIGLLVFMSWPNLIYWSLQFGHMNIGLMFFTILIYSVLRFQSEVPSGRNIVLVLLICVSLILAHHFSSFIMVAFLSLMALMITFGHYSRKMSSWFSRSLNSMWFLAITVLALLYLWWSSYATNIWPVLSAFLNKFVQVLYYRAQNPLVNVAFYPSSLTPLWPIILNYLRVFLIMGLAILGFLLLLKRKAHMHYATQTSFLTITGLVFAILFAFSFQSVAFEWSRIITYAMPVVSICAAYFVWNYLRKLRKSRIIILLLAIFLVVASFLGLWGINYSPTHLYDPAVQSSEVGEHNVNFAPVGLFLNKYIQSGSIDQITSDDIYVLLAILPPSAYNSIITLEVSDFNSSLMQPAQVVEFNGMNPYHYFLSPNFGTALQPKDIETVRTQLMGTLENQTDRIYDNSATVIWARAH